MRSKMSVNTERELNVTRHIHVSYMFFYLKMFYFSLVDIQIKKMNRRQRKEACFFYQDNFILNRDTQVSIYTKKLKRTQK